MRVIPLALALSLFSGGAIAAPATWSATFDGFTGKARTWMKANGFEEQRGSAKAWRVRDGALVTSQDEDSTTVGAKLGSLDPQKAPILKFRARATAWPTGADLRKKGTEDAALRIFVIFDRGGGVFSPPDTLGYAFATNNAKGSFITADRFKNVKYLPVATQADGGGWIEIQRDIVMDYTVAFGRADVPKIKAIGIKSDANNTDTKAGAEIDWITLSPR